MAKFARMLILQLIVRTCLAGIIINTEDKTLNLAKTAAKVLMTCYGDQLKTIHITGKSSGPLITSLKSSEEPLATIIVDKISKSMKKYKNKRPYRNYAQSKQQFFVISTPLSSELNEILGQLRNSRWWNHMANFYILELPVEEHGCSRASEFLSTAWKNNLLKAKFMCTHSTKGPMIYTFNPYTKVAPQPWQLEATYRGENDHPWTMLKRQYREANLCENMDFDITKNLGGYMIPAVMPIDWWSIKVNRNKTGVESLCGVNGNIMRSLFRSLNATMKLTVIEGIKGIVGSWPKKLFGGIRPMSVMIAWSNLTRNLELIPTHIAWDGRMEMKSYPFFQDGIRALTMYRGYKSQLSKIASVFDVNSRIALFVSCLVTPIFLICVVHQTVPTAILNLIRIICNSCLTNLRNNVASRIFVASLMILVITIQGIYQGQLASLLAKRVPLKNVNTIQDLIEDHGGYIYLKERIARQFVSQYKLFANFTEGKDKVLPRTIPEFLEILKKNRSSPYLGDGIELIPIAAKENLHLSREFIMTNYIAWIMPEEWPLEQRFNINLQKLVEAHIVQYEYYNFLKKDLRTIDTNDNALTDRIVKVLNMDDLNFAFVALGIGLASASMCFTIEHAVRRDTYITKIYQYIWHKVRSVRGTQMS